MGQAIDFVMNVGGWGLGFGAIGALIGLALGGIFDYRRVNEMVVSLFGSVGILIGVVFGLFKYFGK